MRNFTAVAVLLFIAISGCTRGAGKASSVQLSFSSEAMSKLSDELGIVIINVTGPSGFTPVFFQWDRSGCGGSPCQVPSSFNLSVTSGPDRMIQLLAVFKDESTGRLTFKYADLKRSLSAGDVPVELSPVLVGGASTEGHVYGRYLETPSGGPTGPLDIQFKPENGSPAMTIIKSYMFNGWFKGFLLDGNARFDYVVNGRPLLSDMHLNSSQLSGAGARVLKVDIPAFDRSDTRNGLTTYRREFAQKFFLGYFGPLAASQAACYDQADSVAIGGAFKVSSPQGETPFTWNGATTVASADGAYAWVEAGGAIQSNASCTSPKVEFVDYLNFQHTQLNNGHDSLAGFRGPFRANMGGGFSKYVEASVAASTLILNWDWLPGVARAGVVKAARVLIRARQGSDSEDELYGSGDGIDCARAQSKLRFQSYGPDVQSLVAGVEISEASISVPGLTATNFNNHDVILCPVMADNSMPAVGVKVYGGGGFMGGGVANSVALKMPEYEGARFYANNACVPFVIEGRNGGTPAPIPESTSLTVEFSPAMGMSVYLDPSCMTLAPTPIALNGMSPKFYMKSSNTGEASVSVIASIAGGLSFNTGAISFSYTDLPFTYTHRLKVNQPATIKAHTCHEYSIEAWRDDGTKKVLATPPGGFYPSLPNPAYLTWYYGDTGPCSEPGSSSVFFNGPVVQKFLKYTGTDANLSLLPTGVAADYLGAPSVSVVQPGLPTSLAIGVQNLIEEGKCVPLQFALRDSNFDASPAGSTITVSPNAGGAGAQFFTDPVCETAGSIQIMMGTSSVNAFLKVTQQGARTISATTSSGLSFAGRVVNTSPPKASKLALVAPGQTLTAGGGVTGSPTPLVVGTPATVSVYGLNYKGEIDTTATESVNFYVTNLNPLSAVSLVNGAATVMITPIEQGVGSLYGFTGSNLVSQYINFVINDP